MKLQKQNHNALDKADVVRDVEKVTEING